jgi:hypothetical protein
VRGPIGVFDSGFGGPARGTDADFDPITSPTPPQARAFEWLDGWTTIPRYKDTVGFRYRPTPATLSRVSALRTDASTTW